MKPQMTMSSLGQTQKWADGKPRFWILPLVTHVVRDIQTSGIGVGSLWLAWIWLSVLVRHVYGDQSGLPVIRNEKDFLTQIQSPWTQHEWHLQCCKRQQRKPKKIIFVLHAELCIMVQPTRSTIAPVSDENVVSSLPVLFLHKLMEVSHFMVATGEPDRCAANVVSVRYIIVHGRDTNKEVISPRKFYRIRGRHEGQSATFRKRMHFAGDADNGNVCMLPEVLIRTASFMPSQISLLGRGVRDS
mmetsp:Transcript_19502/g.47065  ORF Transcript_19502/g.47065 Transcript_19502/m.47065 type:complete len:244 (-) Transcript_19502:2643-3374(-)